MNVAQVFMYYLIYNAIVFNQCIVYRRVIKKKKKLKVILNVFRKNYIKQEL